MKSVEDVATWGGTKRRTTQPKPSETVSGISESQAASADSQAVSTNSSVGVMRLEVHARSTVVKRVKEQTLTASLTELSKVILMKCRCLCFSLFWNSLGIIVALRQLIACLLETRI